MPICFIWKVSIISYFPAPLTDWQLHRLGRLKLGLHHCGKGPEGGQVETRISSDVLGSAGLREGGKGRRSV